MKVDPMVTKTSHYPDATPEKGVELASNVGASLTQALGQTQGLDRYFSKGIAKARSAITEARRNVQKFLELDHDKIYDNKILLSTQTIIDNITSARNSVHSMRKHFPDEASSLHDTLCNASDYAAVLQQYAQTRVDVAEGSANLLR